MKRKNKSWYRNAGYQVQVDGEYKRLGIQQVVNVEGKRIQVFLLLKEGKYAQVPVDEFMEVLNAAAAKAQRQYDEVEK